MARAGHSNRPSGWLRVRGRQDGFCARSAPDLTHWLAVGTQDPREAGPNAIGRDPGARIFRRPGVSRRHAQVLIENTAATSGTSGAERYAVSDRPVLDGCCRVTPIGSGRDRDSRLYMTGSGLSTATQPVSAHHQDRPRPLTRESSAPARQTARRGVPDSCRRTCCRPST